MAVTEDSRYDLHKYFEETMGRERAGALMELLPPVGWRDVATKQDLAMTTADLRQEINLVRKDVDLVRKDVDLVRKDVEHLREWSGQRFEHIEKTMTETLATKVELHAVREDIQSLRGEMYRALKAQFAGLVFVMIGIAGIATATT